MVRTVREMSSPVRESHVESLVSAGVLSAIGGAALAARLLVLDGFAAGTSFCGFFASLAGAVAFDEDLVTRLFGSGASFSLAALRFLGGMLQTQPDEGLRVEMCLECCSVTSTSARRSTRPIMNW